MIRLSEHGGNYGNRKIKGIHVSDIKTSMDFPVISEYYNSSNTRAEFDLLDKRYYYLVNYYGSTCYVDLFYLPTKTYLGKIDLNVPWHTPRGFFRVGNRLFFSIYSGNLNESYDDLVVYDTSTLTKIVSAGPEKSFTKIFEMKNNRIFGSIQLRSSGLQKLVFMDLTSFVKSSIPAIAVDSDFKVIESAKRIAWRDYYNSSIKGFIDYNGATLPAVPSTLFHNNAVAQGNISTGSYGKLIYVATYTKDSNSMVKITMHYFDKQLNLIKSELITPDAGLSGPYTNSDMLMNMAVSKDGRYLLFTTSVTAYQNGSRTTPLDENGFLKFGKEAITKSRKVSSKYLNPEIRYEEGEAEIYTYLRERDPGSGSNGLVAVSVTSYIELN